MLVVRELPIQVAVVGAALVTMHLAGLALQVSLSFATQIHMERQQLPLPHMSHQVVIEHTYSQHQDQ